MNKSKVIIGLINPKSPSNVGAVVRAAGCYDVDTIRYTGNRYDTARKFNTDTKDISKNITLLNTENILDDFSEKISVVCIELAEGAKPLPKFQHPDDALYIFGPEDGTISQDVIDRADEVVYVPTIGCMNLAATVNVVLYDRLAKSDLGKVGDTLIRKSRDMNNRVKVAIKSH